MEPEILFRGKRLDNGEWAESVCPLGTMSCGVVAHDFDPATVGQYTGLTDKNGVKIFVGDKCRVTRTCVIAYGIITFANACFWFVDDGPGGMLRLCDIKPNNFEIEVASNTHDNPELLEVQNEAHDNRGSTSRP